MSCSNKDDKLTISMYVDATVGKVLNIIEILGVESTYFRHKIEHVIR